MRRVAAPELARWYVLLLFLSQLGVFAIAMTQQVRHLGQPVHQAGVAVLGAYLCWAVAELRITTGAPGDGVTESATLAVYATARTATWACGALGPWPWHGWSLWMIPPLALFVGGVVLRLSAIRALGRFYSHHVRRLPGHEVVSSGPYRLVRHPAYTGMALANCGFVLFTVNLAAVCALAWLIAVLVWRIRTEERTMWAVPGYAAYAAGRTRLLPGVW